MFYLFLVCLLFNLQHCEQLLVSKPTTIPSATSSQIPNTTEAYNARMLFFYSPKKQGDICLYDLQYTLPSGNIHTQSLLSTKSFTNNHLTNVLNDAQNNKDYIEPIQYL